MTHLLYMQPAIGMYLSHFTACRVDTYNDSLRLFQKSSIKFMLVIAVCHSNVNTVNVKEIRKYVKKYFQSLVQNWKMSNTFENSFQSPSPHFFENITRECNSLYICLPLCSLFSFLSMTISSTIILMQFVLVLCRSKIIFMPKTIGFVSKGSTGKVERLLNIFLDQCVK